jgi:ribose/xylose/arabinose/galactoside ABC-type transport system permease subunit
LSDIKEIVANEQPDAGVEHTPISKRRFENLNVLAVLIAFMIIIVFLQLIKSASAGAISYPKFVSPVNLLNILMQNAIPGILAVGMTMVIISGGIDLSVGMLSSLVAIFLALCISKWHFPLVPSIICSIMLSVALEGALGFIISRTNVEPFIITLGGMIAFQGIALLLCGSREVTLNKELDFFKKNLIAGAKDPIMGLNLTFPAYVVIFLFIVVLFWAILKFTKFGRRVYAVGCNPQAAFLSGINVKNVRMMVYMINGLLVGIGAVLLLSRINVGNITVGQNLEIDAIAMAVIVGTAMSGGKGNMWGTFIGVLLLGSIGNAMNMLTLPSEVQFVAKGLIIIFSVSAAAISGNRRLRDKFAKLFKRGVNA